MSNRLWYRRLVVSLLAMVPLSILEISLGITKERLGGWFHPYMFASSVIVIAIVFRYVRENPPA